MRGHGLSETKDPFDLSIERLCSDASAIIKLYENNSSRKIILVGHSLGGAVLTKVARSNEIPNTLALVVVDVVEGWI